MPLAAHLVITLDLDLCATAALDGIVQPHDQWTRGGSGVHEQVQGQPRSLQAGPDGAVQDAMILLKKFHMRQTNDLQSGGDSPLAGVRMAPSSSTWTCCHTHFVNRGAKVVMKMANSLGPISIEDLPSS